MNAGQVQHALSWGGGSQHATQRRSSSDWVQSACLAGVLVGSTHVESGGWGRTCARCETLIPSASCTSPLYSLGRAQPLSH